MGYFHTYWLVTILTTHDKDRNLLRNYLKLNGIETRPIFCPIHEMPMYKCDEDFPVTSELSSKGISLPSWPGLLSEDIKYISDCIYKYFDG